MTVNSKELADRIEHSQFGCAASSEELALIVKLLRGYDEERLREAEQIILLCTADHNTGKNYVQGFERARDYFGKYPPMPPLDISPSEGKP